MLQYAVRYNAMSSWYKGKNKALHNHIIKIISMLSESENPILNKYYHLFQLSSVITTIPQVNVNGTTCHVDLLVLKPAGAPQATALRSYLL